MPLFIPTLIFAISLALLPSTEPVSEDDVHTADEYRSYVASRRSKGKTVEKPDSHKQEALQGLGLNLGQHREGEKAFRHPLVIDRDKPEVAGEARGETSRQEAEAYTVKDDLVQTRHKSASLVRHESLTRRRCTSMPPLPQTPTSGWWSDSSSPTLSVVSQPSPLTLTP